MKTTRQKRPDRVICKWKQYEVVYYKEDDGDKFNVKISDLDYVVGVWFPLSEIPNLIKALLIINKTK